MLMYRIKWHSQYIDISKPIASQKKTVFLGGMGQVLSVGLCFQYNRTDSVHMKSKKSNPPYRVFIQLLLNCQFGTVLIREPIYLI